MLVLLPDELPLPIEPLLGEVVLGEVVLLDEPLLGEVLLGELEDELPLVPDELLVPPLEELEDLKCASHSEREIDPSLLVSTDEKLGVLMLELDELGEVVELDEPPAAPVDELPLDVEGEDELPELDLASSAATAARERAKSAAAVVTVTVLSI